MAEPVRVQSVSQPSAEDSLSPTPIDFRNAYDLLSSMPCVAYEYKINHRTGVSSFPYVSPFCEELFGVPAAAVELDPAAMVNLIHPDEVECFSSTVLSSMTQLTPFEFRFRARNHRTGQYITVLDRSLPYRSQEMNSEGVCETVTIWKGVIIDDNDRPEGGTRPTTVGTNETVEKEQEIQCGKALVKNPSVPFFSIDETGCIGLWSEALVKATGHKVADVGGKNILTLLASKEQFPSIPEFIRQLQLNEEVECTLTNAWGSNVHLILSSVRQTDFWYIACKDVTKLRDVELQRKKAVRLAKSERSLTEWLSHEIRNPLSVVMEAAQAMEDPAGGSRTQLGATYLQLIRHSITYVVDILTNMLDLNKLAEGKMVLKQETCNIHDDILFPTQKMMHICGKVPVTITCPDKTMAAFVDKLRVRQVVTNLVSNAIKYTTQGYIDISASEEDGYVEIKVSDSGSGIKPCDYDNLFSRYEQLGSSINGQGIGLCLCKSLVSAMQGDINLNKDYKSGIKGHPGAQFVLRLPLKGKASSAFDAICGALGASIPKSDLFSKSFPIKPNCSIRGKYRILVVDDEKVGQKLLVRRFSRIFPDAQIDCSISGEKAIEMTKNATYDLITMDHYMKVNEMDGAATIRRLRQMGSTACIVGISGNTKSQEHMQAGANDFFQKPIPNSETVVARLLRVMPPPRKFKVLVVDDCPVNLRFMQRRLESLQFAYPSSSKQSLLWDIVPCKEPERAQELLSRESQFDLVVLDSNLNHNKINGATLCLLGRQTQTESTIFVRSSASAGDEDERPGSFDASWSKPLPSIDYMRASLFYKLISY